MYNDNNIFAKIIKGDIPCEKIYEDETCLFFNDINPKAKIHVLAIPKTPNVDFADFVSKNDQDTVSGFFKKNPGIHIKNNIIAKTVNVPCQPTSTIKYFVRTGKIFGIMLGKSVSILGGEKLNSKL